MWALALLVAGIGIGMAWPHLSVWAMDSVDDPAESGAAAAAINTVQLISACVRRRAGRRRGQRRTGRPGAAARWLYAGFTVLAAASVVAAYNATRGDRSSR